MKMMKFVVFFAFAVVGFFIAIGVFGQVAEVRQAALTIGCLMGVMALATMFLAFSLTAGTHKSE